MKAIDKLVKKMAKDADITEQEAYDALYSFCESATMFTLENDTNQVDIIPDSTDDIIFMIEEAPEGGHTAQALGHSIFTEADNWNELKEAVQDAVRCHLEEGEQPTLVRLPFIL